MAVKVVSLNMNGFGNANLHARDHKWTSICDLITLSHIGILLLQETHLTEERHDKLNRMYGHKLYIQSSADPENPTGRGGVAVVYNRKFVHADNILPAVEVVLGRAILV